MGGGWISTFTGNADNELPACCIDPQQRARGAMREETPRHPGTTERLHGTLRSTVVCPFRTRGHRAPADERSLAVTRGEEGWARGLCHRHADKEEDREHKCHGEDGHGRHVGRDLDRKIRPDRHCSPRRRRVSGDRSHEARRACDEGHAKAGGRSPWPSHAHAS